MRISMHQLARSHHLKDASKPIPKITGIKQWQLEELEQNTPVAGSEGQGV